MLKDWRSMDLMRSASPLQEVADKGMAVERWEAADRPASTAGDATLAQP
jgi:hypothetical protein